MELFTFIQDKLLTFMEDIIPFYTGYVIPFYTGYLWYYLLYTGYTWYYSLFTKYKILKLVTVEMIMTNVVRDTRRSEIVRKWRL